jgi:HTH-type transcriptional regulator, competence development regulator
LHSALGTETFGERIRRRRREDKLSQRRLAELVGVDFTYLSKLENNQHGQSPGEELVLKLAEQLHDDSEELLALAGKVPVEALRALAREDADFARFLRRLSAVAADDKRGRLRRVLESGAESDVGRLPELLAPLMEKGGLNDAHIVATLTAGEEFGELVCRVTTDYATRQDEWLWGFVTDQSHRDRLREVGAPLDDIQMIDPEAVGEHVRAEEIARRNDLLVRYRDDDGPLHEVSLERLTDLSDVWRPRVPEDEFPLIVMRAAFPPLAEGLRRRIEFSYSCLARRDEGFWFWTASAPTYVSTITVDARQLAADLKLTFAMALPDFVGRQEGVNGLYSVRVHRWVLPGHGVNLDWRPPDPGRSA